jgi:hypothetical protein
MRPGDTMVAMNDAYQSNIRGSKGRPINPARRAGIVSIRDQMNREDFSLRDRVQARGLDNHRAKTALRSGFSSGSAAPTNIGQRQALFSEMEKAGSAGISTGMRERARKLGVDDTAFNTAAQRIRTNEAFTPGQASATATPPPSVATPASSRAASRSPGPAGMSAPLQVPRYRSSMASHGNQQDEDSARGEETFTGASPTGKGWEATGFRSGQPVWSRKLESRTAARAGAPAVSAPQPVVAASAPVVTKPPGPTALRKSVSAAAAPPMVPAGPRGSTGLPAAPASTRMAALPGMPSSMAPAFPKGDIMPPAPPKMRQTFMSDPAQDRAKEETSRKKRREEERAGMEEVKRKKNEAREVPEWAQPHRTRSTLKRGIGKLVRAMQYEW